MDDNDTSDRWLARTNKKLLSNRQSLLLVLDLVTIVVDDNDDVFVDVDDDNDDVLVDNDDPLPPPRNINKVDWRVAVVSSS